MRYVGQTKLPHGIVMHYSTIYGNIESHFVEKNKKSDKESTFMDKNLEHPS